MLTDPREIPLTSEQQEMMDAINREYINEMTSAIRAYHDKLGGIERDHSEKLQALFLETATNTDAAQLQAWRQERG